MLGAKGGGGGQRKRAIPSSELEVGFQPKIHGEGEAG